MSITDIGPTQLDSFFTSTIKNYQSETKENFVKYRPAIQHLMENAGKRSEGGYMISLPATYGFNNTTTFFDGMDRIDTTPQETALPAQYWWRNVYSAVAIAETDSLANSGKSAIFDLMMTRIKQAEKSIRDIVNQEIYGDGTNYNSKTIIGFAAGISTTPTVDPTSGAVGGIPASNTWWQNAAQGTFSWATNGVNGTGADDVFNLYNTLTDGNEVYPTMILSDQSIYQFYNASLVKQERIIQGTRTQAVTLNQPFVLVYGPNNTPWYWDRQCPSGYMYMVNNNDVKFYIDPRWYMTWGPPKSWPDQEATVRILKLRILLAYTRRMFLGVASGVTA